MGNCICTSCCNADEPQLAKIIDAHGNLRYFKPPITAAEIMLEQPGYFLSPADDLHHNSRLTALRADEELSGGNLYMLIPAARVRSKVSKSDLEIVEFASNPGRLSDDKQCRSSPPETDSDTDTDTEKEGESTVNLLEGKDSGFTGYMSSSCRQWKPVLEPIYER